MAKTEVILTHNIVGLGGESDHVKVAAGYARNYLFPQGLAVPVSGANKRRLEALKQRRAEREAHEFNTMSELAKSVSNLIAVIAVKTVCGVPPGGISCKGGPLCYVKFGTAAFILSALMLIAEACPQIGRVTDFTWFGPAQVQLQILGFFTVVMSGAIYELLPRVMGFGLPFPKFVRLQHWLFMLGIVLWAGSLAVGGVEQGIKLRNPSVAFADSTGVALIFLRAGTTGLLFLLLGSLLFAANIFAMTLKWKLALLKSLLAAVKAPLEIPEVKS